MQDQQPKFSGNVNGVQEVSDKLHLTCLFSPEVPVQIVLSPDTAKEFDLILRAGLRVRAEKAAASKPELAGSTTNPPSEFVPEKPKRGPRKAKPRRSDLWLMAVLSVIFWEVATYVWGLV